MTGLSTTSPPGAGGRDRAPQRVALEQHGPYTANLMKVGAMLPETLALLAAWEGQSREVFTRQVVEGNLVGKATRRRLADLLGRVFWRRFPAEGTPGLPHASAFVRTYGASEASRLVCLYHAASAEVLLWDLVLALGGPAATQSGTAFGPGVPLVSTEPDDAGLRIHQRAVAGHLTTEDAVRFIRAHGGAPAANWSANTAIRTARGALAALRDFGVLEGRARKRLASRLPVPLPAFLYVAHTLRDQGAGAREIAGSPAWRLFLLGQADVELLFLRAHAAGHLRYYRLGDVWRIDWMHRNLAALLAALAAESPGASDPVAGRAAPSEKGGPDATQ